MRPDPATGQILGVSRRVDPSLVPTAPTVAVLGAVAVVALAVFGLLGVLRMVQGGPSAAVDGSVPAASAGSGAATADLAAGDRLLVVQPGDSLWTIALEIAPERDPRPLVVALAEANGGDSLQIGQQIVIPSQLLD